MSKQQTTRVVLAYMQKHPGQIMHYIDIANDIGQEFTINSVATSLARMHKDHPEYGVSRTGNGLYIFRLSDVKRAELVPVDPELVEPGDVFEVVGKTKKGTILLKGTKSGTIYTLGEEL